MAIQQTTQIPEVRDTIVMLRQLSADEQVRQEAYYREKRLHDEATALGNARREGKAELREEKISQMRKLGFTEEKPMVEAEETYQKDLDSLRQGMFAPSNRGKRIEKTDEGIPVSMNLLQKGYIAEDEM